jgi:septum site-determining protein MinC
MSLVNAPSASSSKVCFQFKSGAFTLPVIQLYAADMQRFDSELGDKVQQAPRFFENAPVIIDLQKISSDETEIDFERLCHILKRHRLCAIGLRGGSMKQQAEAQAAGFVLLGESPIREEKRTEERTETRIEALPNISTPSDRSPTRVITQPVRSGQQIYARGGDLLVLAHVSAGAELLADGHIHVYGALRGRALAGITGDTETHIFCSSLEAELISIAGHYRVSEDLKENLWKCPAHISLNGEQLLIKEIE